MSAEKNIAIESIFHRRVLFEKYVDKSIVNVVVLKNSAATYWYKNYIGHVFTVVPYKKYSEGKIESVYTVIYPNFDTIRYIELNDCEVIK